MEVEQYEDIEESGRRSIEEIRKLYAEQIREITFHQVSFRYPGKADTRQFNGAGR